MKAEQKEKLLQLLSRGDLRAAVDYLLSLELSEAVRADAHALAARFRKLEQQQRRGLLTHEQATVTENNIIAALIELVQQGYRSRAVSFPPPPKKEKAPGGNRLSLTTVGLSLGILASIATILAFAFDVFGSRAGEPAGTPRQLTVYVHGNGGKQDYVLENEGEIVLTLGNDRRVAQVGEHGRTNFGEIPSRFLGKELGLSVRAEGYKLAQPALPFTFDGEPVYLEVQSSCRYCRLRGVVQAAGRLVSGAVVLVKGPGLTDTTDVAGNFDIQVPPEEEAKEYILSVLLDGRIIWENYVTPSPKTPIEILVAE